MNETKTTLNNSIRVVNGYTIKHHADLVSANLAGTNLVGVDLRYADLVGADLRYTDLEGADLEGADLRFAMLAGAKLRGANLSGVNLKGVNLKGVNLEGVNLKGADFEGAILGKKEEPQEPAPAPEKDWRQYVTLISLAIESTIPDGSEITTLDAVKLLVRENNALRKALGIPTYTEMERSEDF